MKKVEKMTDGIIGTLTGRKIKTVLVSLDEMIDLIDRAFLQQVETEEERRAVYKACTSIISKQLDSKDGNYTIEVWRYQRIFLNVKEFNKLYFHDKTTDTYYKYHAFFWRKMKKTLAAKCGIS